jgi:hypothetical protein
MTYEFADLGVSPKGSLAETALILGEALGNIDFKLDTHGRFDEYPAFVAENGGLRYALLGIPCPHEDVRDEPHTDFALLVESVDSRVGEARENISIRLLSRIEGDGRLTCWQL